MIACVSFVFVNVRIEYNSATLLRNKNVTGGCLWKSSGVSPLQTWWVL